MWWQTSDDEVYPWSPLAKDRDRANILVYSLRGTALTLVCYCRTEMAPLSVSFSRLQPSVLLTVEQGFGRKGGVTVLSCVYEVRIGGPLYVYMYVCICYSLAVLYVPVIYLCVLS